MGCCAYNMLNVVRGSYKSFSNLNGAYSWDVLAGFNRGATDPNTLTIDSFN